MARPKIALIGGGQIGGVAVGLRPDVRFVFFSRYCRAG